ncbi:DUF4381 domain-containing protein [Pukyongiella litopenaei]|uniref:DUF4381 domain-containing protein n=1 Tax=Pukyongiella litopenaei TaxID=2605946 RepID=A0A2S0MT60_9RHOB|nr:DUF4381 domain-containing protein [Pukyongiella litopenaei]AVO39074.1 DUF4381 domain-containing protein [Pukyongiella litopenaei]
MSDAQTGTGSAAAGAGPENLVDLIDGLIDPVEPPPVPLVPQTWGWAALAVLIVVLLAWLLWRWAARCRADAYRRAALTALDQAGTAADIAVILRRAALAAYPRAEVAGLAGRDWVAYLDRTGRGGFPAAAGEELRLAPYRDDAAAPSDELRDAAGTWLRTHRAATMPADHGGKA